MEAQHKKRKYKVIIIILLLLLLVSAVLLARNLKNRYLNVTAPNALIITDNIIQADGVDPIAVPTEDPPPNTSQDNMAERAFASAAASSAALANNELEDPGRALAGAPLEKTTKANSSGAGTHFATSISLSKNKADANLPFRVDNLFPGDVETKYYSVQVSYRDTATVKFFAEIRPGYEKLAQVLKTEIILLNTGETLYDGLMNSMPKSLDYVLVGDKKSTQEVFYKITAYLDTRVDNQYQDKELVADFQWWLEGDTSTDPPIMGENLSVNFWFGLMSIAMSVLILFYIKIKNKEGRHESYR